MTLLCFISQFNHIFVSNFLVSYHFFKSPFASPLFSFYVSLVRSYSALSDTMEGGAPPGAASWLNTMKPNKTACRTYGFRELCVMSSLLVLYDCSGQRDVEETLRKKSLHIGKIILYWRIFIDFGSTVLF